MATFKINALQMPDGNVYQFLGTPYYGMCNTAATEQTKVIDLYGELPRDQYYALQDGTEILVWFANPQRYDGQAQLHITGIAGSKPVYYDIPNTSAAGYNAWSGGDIVRFTYRNNSWYMARRDYITLADLPIWNGSVT